MTKTPRLPLLGKLILGTMTSFSLVVILASLAVGPSACTTAQLASASATSSAVIADAYAGAITLYQLVGTNPTVAKIVTAVQKASTNPNVLAGIQTAESVANLAASFAGTFSPSVGIGTQALVAAGTAILNQGIKALQNLPTIAPAVATAIHGSGMDIAWIMRKRA
jgi:hypothetical protein